MGEGRRVRRTHTRPCSSWVVHKDDWSLHRSCNRLRSLMGDHVEIGRNTYGVSAVACPASRVSRPGVEILSTHIVLPQLVSAPPFTRCSWAQSCGSHISLADTSPRRPSSGALAGERVVRYAAPLRRSPAHPCALRGLDAPSMRIHVPFQPACPSRRRHHCRCGRSHDRCRNGCRHPL